MNETLQLRDTSRMLSSIIHRICTEPMAITLDGAINLAMSVQAGDVHSFFNSLLLDSSRNESKRVWDNTFSLMGDRFGNPTPKMSVDDGVAVIPLQGTVVKGAGNLGRWLGMAELNQFHAEVNQAESDPKVRGVVLNINSPGGFTTGVSEAANAVSRLSSKKPTIAFSDSMMASAAYWVGGAATAVYTTSSALVGSIGTFVMVEDITGLLEKLGVKVQVFRSGEFKATGAPGVALTDKQKDYIQSRVDANSQQFKSFISSKRSMIKDEDMQGQVFYGHEAATRGFVGGLVESFDEALGKLRR